MPNRFRHIIAWAGAVLIYGLAVWAVLVLIDINEEEPQEMGRFARVAADNVAPEVVSHEGGAPPRGLSAILLPLGPGDGRLPGLPQIWEEYVSAGQAEGAAADGFDGLLAVEEIADFSREETTELFLNASPVRLYRRGSRIVLLNTRGKVLLIDCRKPGNPRPQPELPFEFVSHMEMRGDLLYLLVNRPGERNSDLVALELADKAKPRVLGSYSLPQAKSFFFMGGFLVAYCHPDEGNQSPFLEIFSLEKGFPAVSRGRTDAVPLHLGFQQQGDYLLVPGPRRGLNVYDFSDPLRPKRVASLNIPAVVKQFVLRGETVFAKGADQRMYVIDMHDPLHPSLKASINGAKYYAYFSRVGDYTYYFTQHGLLQVYNLTPRVAKQVSTFWGQRLRGQLLAAPGGRGFTLLGTHSGPLPDGLIGHHVLPGGSKAIDAVTFSAGVAVLLEDGRVQLFSLPGTGEPQLLASIGLPSGQRWLATDNERIYAGGGSALHVIDLDAQRGPALVGQVEIRSPESWDGLTVGETLCVAAGTGGLLTFSLAGPGLPTPVSVSVVPAHLSKLLDVRQVALGSGGRVFAAGGSAGLLAGHIVEGRFLLDGLLPLKEPVAAIAAVGRIALAATSRGVVVIDHGKDGAMQNLGTVSLGGVSRLLTTTDYWAAFVRGAGWLLLKTPHFLDYDEALRLRRTEKVADEPLEHLYFLNHFGPSGVRSLPGIIHFEPGQRLPGRAWGAYGL